MKEFSTNAGRVLSGLPETAICLHAGCSSVLEAPITASSAGFTVCHKHSILIQPNSLISDAEYQSLTS